MKDMNENINKSDYEKLLEEYRDFRKEAYKKQWAISSEALKNSGLIDELLVKMCKSMHENNNKADDNDGELFENIDVIESIYERLKRLYAQGRISKEGFLVAFEEGLISEESYKDFLEEVKTDGVD